MTRCLCSNGIHIGLLATRKSRRTAVAFVMHTYIHTYIPTVLPSRSFTTSFVFPSVSDPATTFETHYWKKLTCGVIRSFNSRFRLQSLCVFIQRPLGPNQRDTIQLWTGERQLGHKEATRCIKATQNGKYWSYFK